jgi:hypothetical protein
MREHIEQLSEALQELHRLLLEIARAEYDRGRAAPTPPGRFLQALVEDPALQWLRPMSRHIVELDMLAEDDERLGELDATRLAADAEALFAVESELGRRYPALLQEHPDVIVAHGRVRAALTRLRGK